MVFVPWSRIERPLACSANLGNNQRQGNSALQSVCPEGTCKQHAESCWLLTQNPKGVKATNNEHQQQAETSHRNAALGESGCQHKVLSSSTRDLIGLQETEEEGLGRAETEANNSEQCEQVRDDPRYYMILHDTESPTRGRRKQTQTQSSTSGRSRGLPALGLKGALELASGTETLWPGHPTRAPGNSARRTTLH